MKDIPPPLTPRGGDDDGMIYLPFVLADAPRLQLEFLARYQGIPENHRTAIKKWLYQYNSRMAKWIYDNYGPEAVRFADSLSRQSAERMNLNQRTAQEKVERELFAFLEEELGKDG